MNRQARRHPTQQQSIKPNIQPKTEIYQGVLPPPTMMMGFGNVDSSFPERIVKMAEEAGNRQMQQLLNQKLQIELENENNKLQIKESTRLKELEIKARNRDAMFKNFIAFLGLVSAICACASLIYFAYQLLIADKTGQALIAASPLIGCALVAVFRIFRK